MRMRNTRVMILGAICVIASINMMHAQEQQESDTSQIEQIDQQISNLQDELSVQTVEEVEKDVASLQKELEQVQQQTGDDEQQAVDQIDRVSGRLDQLKSNIKNIKQEKWYLDPRAEFPSGVGTVEDPVVTDIDTFNRIIEENELVVAYLFKLPPQEREIMTEDGIRRRSDRWYAVDSNAMAFGAVAERKMYLKADVPFIAVNLNADQLNRLIDRYDIAARDTIMLFKDGVPYTNNLFTGPFDQYSIRKYIDRYFEDAIQERIEEKREQREKKKEREVVKEVRYERRPRIGFNVGYGSHYNPYYGGYGSHYRPYYGGYGRRHYGYPYRRGGFGFHFGI